MKKTLHTFQSPKCSLRGTTPNGRRTLAFFGPGMFGELARALWSGLLDAARKHDVNLLYIAGDSLCHPEGFRKQANVLYDIFNPGRVDGIISWTSRLDQFVSPEEFTTFLARYSAMPMVSVGEIMEGMPSLVMDSYQGMYAAVEHLITAHGARHLAFLRGPEEHFYAQERYRAYRDALQAHHIPCDDELITPPYAWDFSYGAEAVHLLLDERGLQPGATFDAVVCVNDKMALGAIQALQVRGLRVPHDLAVTGFNDDPEGRFHTPSLSSVKAPFHELGAKAIDMLLAALAGDSVPSQVNIPARFVARQSCGCVSQAVAQASAKPHNTLRDPAGISQTAQHEELIARIVAVMEKHDETLAWVKQVLDAFFCAIEDGPSGTFVLALSEVLCRTAETGNDVARWHAAFSLLRQHVLPSLETKDALLRAEDVWQQARIEIWEAERRQQGARELLRQQQAQRLRDLSTALLTTFDVAGLMDSLFAGLPRLGIPGCYLALYDNPNAPAKGAQLMLAYNEQRRLELKNNGHHSRSFGSIPKELMFGERRSTLMVEALYFQEDQIGFVLFDVELSDGTVYEILRNEISSALQGALLVRQTQAHQAELARERDLLHTLMNSSPDYLFFKDRESRFIRTNTAHAQQLLGLPGPEEAMGKTDFDLFPQQEAQRFFDEEQRIMATGQSVVAREWALHSSTTGKVVWLSEHKVPIRDADGQVVGLVGISRDVTAQKQAEAAFAREKYIVDTFLENVPDSVYFKDRESRFIRCNQALTSAFGLSDPRDLIGKKDFDFLPEDTARQKYEQEQEIVQTGQPLLNCEEPVPNQRWSLTTKMPLRDEHGEIIGTFGISRDITDLKRAQEKLQQHAHELAEAYDEIRLLNTQLQEENLRMGAELDVSRRIQQMVLPSPQELKQTPGLDIVGYMQPAEEVGGDYYDILQKHGALSETGVASGNGVAYVGIGDVTGHGLESGVLMLMTQTAIRTLLEHGETDPVAFVTTLNRTIYQNLQRMQVDKTLTFTLIRYQDGHLNVVGQHEDVLVVRAGGRVERIDTTNLGFPVGLEQDIQQWVQEASVSLASGDGVVLYTDGITEAANAANEFYGIERLCEVVSQHWEASAETIKQAVIDDVTWHIGEQKVHDDLTLVILKQLG